jgi:hypothetical protein
MLVPQVVPRHHVWTMAHEVRCSDCGTLLPSGQNPPLPCPECGSESRSVSASVSASIGISTSVEYATSANNDAKARVWQLEFAIGALEAALNQHLVTETQNAAKAALEAIHELADELKRGEWSQARWGEQAVGLWHGLLGARNAAHHKASPIVARHSGKSRDESLLWSVDPETIATLRWPHQQTAYNERLHGHAVLPQLRQMLLLLKEAVE